MRLLCFLFINILLGYSTSFVKGENLFQDKKDNLLKKDYHLLGFTFTTDINFYVPHRWKKIL